MNSENKNRLMCSWCRRVKDGTETWILPAGAEETDTPDPSVSHGVCDDCYDEKIEEITTPAHVE